MSPNSFIRRVHFLRVITGLVLILAAGRLFYLQVIRHGHFQLLASEGQLRKYEVLPRRGTILASDRGQAVPLVLNKDLKKIYADPRFIENVQATAESLSPLLNEESSKIAKKIESEKFFSVLARGVEPALAEKVQELELAGIGIQDEPVRVYPEGTLASHVLGFVNLDGDGQYGIEETLNTVLQGERGLLKATTDTRGIPIATSDNFQIPPTEGADVLLTIDRNIQAKVEQVIQNGKRKYNATSASAIVLDPNSGAVLGMANYPDFDPAKFSSVSNFNLFSNQAASGLYEPGSVIKVLTMATGLETAAVSPTTTYLNTGSVRVADRVIQNASGIPTGRFNMNEVIVKSINSGVVFVLQAMGGGEITETAKQTMYNFFTNKFGLGAPTGIEIPVEPAGVIREPTGSDVDYANMTFGQGMSATMLQVASAFSVIANGGKLFKPYLVDSIISARGEIVKTEPVIKGDNLISPETIKHLKSMMNGVVLDTGDAVISGYGFGGKSGTAQIPNPAGGYFENRDIGSFVGVAPLSNPRYVVMVRIDEPNIGTFASAAARPMAGEIMKWLLTYGGIPPTR